ncbi:MAG: ribosome biogenesis GTPase YlqF [Cyanobacteria bacterium P01_H01_bin.74]
MSQSALIPTDPSNDTLVQWYPGHIAKYEKQLKSTLKLVDIVVEVVDARIPLSTTNKRFLNSAAHKLRLVVLNKSDLADPKQTAQWVNFYKSQEINALAISAKNATAQKQQLIAALIKLGEGIQQKMLAKGRKRRVLRVLVAGMPNVGKSTLINSIVNRKKTKTGYMAGVTRATQWIRIHPQVDLLDSPGIIPPQLEETQSGVHLSVANCVGEKAFDDEKIASRLIAELSVLYPNCLHRFYNLPEQTEITLEQIARTRGYKLRTSSRHSNFDTADQTDKSQLDCLRAAQSLLNDFRHGRFGRLTLEQHPLTVVASQ